MNADEKRGKPVLISVLVILGLIGAVLNIGFAFFGPSGYLETHLPVWLKGFWVALGAAMIVCMYGLSKMKRWSVWMYAAIVVVAVLVPLAAFGFPGPPRVTPIVLRIVFLGLMLVYYKDMN